MKYNEKKNAVKTGVDSEKIVLDDAGRFELDDERLDKVAAGMRGTFCRIQTDTRGCGTDM